MKEEQPCDEKYSGLDSLIEEIIGGETGDNEIFQTFYQTISERIEMPVDAFVIGVPVTVTELIYEGHQRVRRAGLEARCRRENSELYVVALQDVRFPSGSEAARYVDAYRRWLGLEPVDSSSSAGIKRRHKVEEGDIVNGEIVELAVLSLKENAFRCRLIGSDREITVRARGYWRLVPSDIVSVKAEKQWRFAGHPYMSGQIVSSRIDIAALGLEPLKLEDMGMWNPEDEYWGEDGEPIEEWAAPIIVAGPRPQFEMEQVIPGEDPEDPFDDPITCSVDLKNAGEYREAETILHDLCQADLCCLDAHAHLGNLRFDNHQEDAIRHYKVGFSIGELSLGRDFKGVLPWGCTDNRPFLRCVKGYGLCAWQLGRFDEVLEIFQRMFWLNPSDNQGIRFLIDDVRANRKREDSQDDFV